MKAPRAGITSSQRRRPRQSSRALAALGCALVVSACSSDGKQQGKAPEPSPPPTAPAEGQAPTASDPEPESPREFIFRWQAEADRMVVTGDDKEFRAISRGCTPCNAYADAVGEAYDAGGAVRFGGSTVERMVVEADDPPTYVVTVSSRRLRIVVPGRKTEVFPAATQRYRMTLARAGRSYVLRHYSVL